MTAPDRRPVRIASLVPSLTELVFALGLGDRLVARTGFCVHPKELVSEALRRIEADDGPIGSVVALRADDALDDAARSGREGPLAGIPFLVKDLADCAGLRTTYGSKLYADAPPAAADGVQAARLTRCLSRAGLSAPPMRTSRTSTV